MAKANLAIQTPLPNDIVRSFTAAELKLVDSPPERAFDALTRLASRLFNVPVSLISIVQEDQDRQYFKSQVGLTDPWASKRQTPMTHSFCQYVKKEGAPLRVTSAPDHPLVRDNLAVRDLGVVAYLGAPIFDPDGIALGALCVISDEPREWTEADVATLCDIADCVTDEIKLRAALLSAQELHAELSLAQKRARHYSAMRESIAASFMAPGLSAEDRFSQLLKAGCMALGAKNGVIAKIQGDAMQIMFEYRTDGGQAESERVNTGGTLSELLLSGEELVTFSDLTRHGATVRHDLHGERPSRFAGMPLILDGILYGTLEFSADTPRDRDLDNNEIGALTIIAMFATAQLELLSQIKALRSSEAALFSQILDMKSCAAR